jgi:ketosteroid isomerase-like protein
MTDRTEFEKIIRDAYAARIRGDVDAMLRFFDPGALFEFAGGPLSPVGARAVGAGALRTCFTEFCNAFKMQSHDILSLLIDGPRAALRARIKITSAITGETVETELVDFVELKEGRIISFTQYCDTALVARLAPR